MDDLLSRIFSETQMDKANETESRPSVSQVPNDALALLVPNGDIGRVRMSFNPSTPDGAVKLVMATMQELPPLEEQNGKTLLVTDYIKHPATTAGDTEGEVKDFDRIVVFTSDGKAYSCGSQGVQKSLAVMEMTRGLAPWQPPYKVTVRSRRLANKNMWLTMEPDLEDLQKLLAKRK